MTTVADAPTSAQSSSPPRIEPPKPGVYQGIPADVYHAWPCCSFSRLSRLRQSPAHCRDSILYQKRTRALVIGDAAHLFVLQPELVESRYTVAGPCSAVKLGDGKPCSNAGTIEHDGKWFCGVHKPKGQIIGSGRAVLTEAECDQCVAMRDSILCHAWARDLLEMDGPRELSIVWNDEETGVLCKGRIDKLALEVATIGDFKTTINAKRSVYMRKLYGYGYHMQGAMYLDGARCCGLDARHFVLITTEKESPYAVATYRLMDEVINGGREQVRELIRTYAQCEESGKWPAYGIDIEDIDLPSWDWRTLQQGDD